MARYARFINEWNTEREHSEEIRNNFANSFFSLIFSQSAGFQFRYAAVPRISSIRFLFNIQFDCAYVCRRTCVNDSRLSHSTMLLPHQQPPPPPTIPTKATTATHSDRVIQYNPNTVSAQSRIWNRITFINVWVKVGNTKVCRVGVYSACICVVCLVLLAQFSFVFHSELSQL